MSKQRKFILVSAIVGIIAMFLPWIDMSFLGKVNGMHGKGIIVFICFLIAGALAYIGDQTKNLEKTFWFITLICGAVGLLLMILFYSDTNQGFISIPLSFGFYIAAIATLGVLASAYLFKSPGDSIKSGIESLTGKPMSQSKEDKTGS